MDMIVKSESLTNVAKAIREKGNTSEPLVWPQGYILAISDMETGSATAPITIRVLTSNEAAINPTITIVNTHDNTVFQEFVYEPETVVKIPAGMPYRIDSGKVNGYSAPASVEGLAIAGEARTVELVYQFGRRYGFRRIKAESNPYARIEYLYDAIGMTPMSVDQTSGEPDYGSWKDFIDEICRPVMLKYDGTVDYELDHEDQTKKLDGTASDVSNTSYGGNAMVEFSGFKWVHRSENDDYQTVIFSDLQFDETYHAYAHTNANGDIQDAFYWGMFTGVYNSSKLRSIGTGSIMVEQTRTTEISRAQANGSGYYTIYKSGWDYIADMITLLGKNDNSQAVFGSGRTKNGNTSAKAAGSLKNKPAFCGYSDGTSDVKVLYIEGIWGNVRESLAGIVVDASTKNYKVSMVPPYNVDGDAYVDTNITASYRENGGYVKNNVCTDQFGYIPIDMDGSETTYMCDLLLTKLDRTVPCVAVTSGGYNEGGIAGSRTLYMHISATSTNTSIGTRLSYLKEE